MICEGESDCHTLWYHGEPALGLPGAANWNENRDASFFDNVPVVYVIHEGDKGGEAVEDWLSKSRIRDRARLVSLDKWGVKDPSALHVQDPGQFKARWQEALRDAVAWVDQAAVAAAEDREAAWQACGNLAKASDILAAFIGEFGRLAVGEARTAKLLFLALVTPTTCRTSHPSREPSTAGPGVSWSSGYAIWPRSHPWMPSMS